MHTYILYYINIIIPNCLEWPHWTWHWLQFYELFSTPFYMLESENNINCRF